MVAVSDNSYKIMTIKESVTFNVKSGSLISGEIFRDYLTMLTLQYGTNEEDNKYMFNICDKTQKNVITLLKNISRDIVLFGAEQSLIEAETQRNFNLVYDSLALSVENQKRVASLINKLKKEELTNKAS